jgi:hypothetical protein
MSLKAFHIVFIGVSIVFCFGFAAWCYMQFTSGGTVWHLSGAIFSAVSGIGLVFYAKQFLHKLRSVRML